VSSFLTAHQHKIGHSVPSICFQTPWCRGVCACCFAVEQRITRATMGQTLSMLVDPLCHCRYIFRGMTDDR